MSNDYTTHTLDGQILALHKTGEIRTITPVGTHNITECYYPLCGGMVETKTTNLTVHPNTYTRRVICES